LILLPDGLSSIDQSFKRVNISEATCELINSDTDFKFESRGKLSTKAKGEVEMWIVDPV
jgi:hypothetical protein